MSLSKEFFYVLGWNLECWWELFPNTHIKVTCKGCTSHPTCAIFTTKPWTPTKARGCHLTLWYPQSHWDSPKWKPLPMSLSGPSLPFSDQNSILGLSYNWRFGLPLTIFEKIPLMFLNCNCLTCKYSSHFIGLFWGANKIKYMKMFKDEALYTYFWHSWNIQGLGVKCYFNMDSVKTLNSCPGLQQYFYHQLVW